MAGKIKACRNCGAEVEEGDRFCGECGEPVDRIVPPGTRGPGTDPTPPEQGPVAGPPATAKKRRSTVKIAILGLLVVAVLGAAAWSGYKWLTSRPVHIDTSQLLPKAAPQRQSQPQPAQPQPGFDQPRKIVRGWLGVSAQDVPWELANRMGMATPRGALVNGCQAGSPADRAGILPGDVLVEMNGVQIANARDLRERVRDEIPGRVALLVVWRQGSFYRVSLLVAERPPNVEAQQRAEAGRYASAYGACFARYCPGCHDPLDLFKEQTPACRQCEAANRPVIENCAAYARP